MEVAPISEDSVVITSLEELGAPARIETRISRLVTLKPFLTDAPRREFKLGIAIPCHTKDVHLLKYCLKSVGQLNPKPHIVILHLNEGIGLKEARAKLWNHLFYEKKCDVILTCDADFHLHRHILKHVERNRVCSFRGFGFFRHTIVLTILGVLMPFTKKWNGCFSLPIELWTQIKDDFDGSDSSVRKTVKSYKWINNFSYTFLTGYEKKHVESLLSKFPLWKRIWWKMTRLNP